MRRRLLPALLLLPLLAACGEDATPADLGPNDPPQAVLTSPEATQAGRTTLLRADDSDDPDGVITTYIFDFGDGSPFFETLSPTAWHTWAEPGDYRVTLSVLDDRGSKDSIQQRLRVD